MNKIEYYTSEVNLFNFGCVTLCEHGIGINKLSKFIAIIPLLLDLADKQLHFPITFLPLKYFNEVSRGHVRCEEPWDG
jgi:hypothetical protein